MEGLAREQLSQEGLPVEQMVSRRYLDVRYLGQSFELTVDYSKRPTSGNFQRSIGASFYRAHLQRFGYADRAQPVEIVNLRLKLELPVEKPRLPGESRGDDDPSAALTGQARVIFRDGPKNTPMYQRDRRLPGNRLTGPALLLQMDATIILSPGWAGTVDSFGNLVAERV